MPKAYHIKKEELIQKRMGIYSKEEWKPFAIDNQEINDILDRLNDEDNPISEEYLDEINFKQIDYWADNGDISDSLANFLKLLFRKLSIQSFAIRVSVERLKSGEWKTYNKHEGL